MREFRRWRATACESYARWRGTGCKMTLVLAEFSPTNSMPLWNGTTNQCSCRLLKVFTNTLQSLHWNVVYHFGSLVRGLDWPNA